MKLLRGYLDALRTCANRGKERGETMQPFIMTADKAVKKLKDGNKKYLDSETGKGNISRALRLDTKEHGQHPYAIIVTCSDSRVIPESIFSAGIGDLFVIRVGKCH